MFLLSLADAETPAEENILCQWLDFTGYEIHYLILLFLNLIEYDKWFFFCLRFSAHASGSVMLIEIMSYLMLRKSLIYWSETKPLHPLFICLIHYENMLVLFQNLLKNAQVTVPCFQNIRTQYYFLTVCIFRLHFPLIKFCTFGTW